MRYYRFLSELAILALATSCTVAEPEGSVLSRVALQKEITITATSGEPDTRTERVADGSVLWSPGDQISLFYGSGTNGGSCFTAQNTETAKTVNFTGTIGVITGGNNIAVEDTYFWAVYPYNATASCDGTSITTVLPSEQVATADTFADDLFPSIGRSQGLNMAFYNICGGIKFTVSEEDIKSVTLKANGGEQIVGTITAAFDGGVPVVTNVANGSDTITLTAPEGEAFEVGKSYYFVMVPTVFQSGFTMTFSKGYARAERVITSKATIKRSVFGTMNTPDAGLEWEMLYVPIPDENFRAYMIQNFDANGNGVLDFSEAEAVTRIDVCTDDITSLEGIEYCLHLQSLICKGSCPDLNNPNGVLLSLDLSSNPELVNVDCSYNQLNNIQVRTCTALAHLNCNKNKLTALDVSQNSSLSSLYCGYNQLTGIDLTVCAALTHFDCAANKLTNLDVSHQTALKELDCYGNQLPSLDISNNTLLTRLNCGANPLTSLDVSNNISLVYLRCGDNKQLTNLDVSANVSLDKLDCQFCNLSSLDLSNNTQLRTLWCNLNVLTSLQLSANIALVELRCNSNQLSNLDISGNTALAILSCGNNLITCLNVANNTALQYLECSPMKDAEGNNLLGYLYIAQGQSIPNVTVDRSNNYIPAETVILVAPETGGSEGTIEEPLN
ncbi:MAG: hypothetical protein IJU68_06960 [Bacteroidales bacterium]|nr:hypothetical protein [Bacteroidales bacterium]